MGTGANAPDAAGCLDAARVVLDDLAAINERLGNNQGDQGLCDLADVLTAFIRESDVLARAGGDESVVLVEDDAPAAEALAGRIRRRIAAVDTKNQRPYELAAGLDLAFLPTGEAATLEQLIERAGRRGDKAKVAPWKS